MPFNSFGQWIPGPSPQTTGQASAFNLPQAQPMVNQQQAAFANIQNPNVMPMVQQPQANNQVMFNPNLTGSLLNAQQAQLAPQNYGSQMMPPAYQPSVEQQAGNSGSPQSVSNYLQALQQQTVGAGSNPSGQVNTNLQMNSQNGYQGFQGYQGGTLNNFQVPQNYGFNGSNYNPWQGSSSVGGFQAGSVGSGPGWQNSGQPNFNYQTGQQVAANNAQQYQAQQAAADQQQAQAAQQAQQNAWNQQAYGQTNQYAVNPYNGQFYNTSGQLGALSDINSKTDIQDAGSELDQFFDSLGIYSYEYKDKKDGDGRRISPMAQEIASTPLGQAAISRDERGLMKVDYGKLMGTILAGTAMNHQRLKDLEDKVKAAMAEKLGKVNSDGE